MNIEAMWTIQFGSMSQSLGAGILILETGRAFGGDTSFAYVGSYDVGAGGVSGKLRVSRHSPGLPSIYGDGVDDFELEYSASPQADGTMLGRFVRSGYSEGGFILRRIAELP